MLIKIQFRFPELFLGMLLAVALFALGVVFKIIETSAKPRNIQHQGRKGK